MAQALDYDFLFIRVALEMQLLTPEQIAQAQSLQQKLQALQIFHLLGKICLEIGLLNQVQAAQILEKIQSLCQLSDKPSINIFLLEKSLSDHLLVQAQKAQLLSDLQWNRCRSLQNTLRAFGIERHLIELALEEQFLTRTQLEPFLPKTTKPEIASPPIEKVESATSSEKSFLFYRETSSLAETQPETRENASSVLPKKIVQDESSHTSATKQSISDLILPETQKTPSSSPPSPLESVGKVMMGDYEILEEVSRGGMGIIYKARQKSLDRIVALKVLKGGEEVSKTLIERFNLEAKAVAQLSHPNILPIYDYGTYDNFPYFAMEFLDGLSLRELLKKQTLPIRQAVLITVSVANALQHAHEKGFCHRDIKPANIMIDKTNRVFLMDFGLVKNFNQNLELTSTGALMGTPAYMSPEQVDTNKFGKVGVCSDIYSLGAVFYEMLTHMRPYADKISPKANTVSLALAIISASVKAPRFYNKNIPETLEKICLKCLEKRQENRYKQVSDLIKDLDLWLKSDQVPRAQKFQASENVLPVHSTLSKETTSTKVPFSTAPRVLFMHHKKEGKGTEKKILPSPSSSGEFFHSSSKALSTSPLSSGTLKHGFPQILDFELKKKLQEDVLGELFIARQQSTERYVQIRVVPKKIQIVSQTQTNPLFQNYFAQVQKLGKIYHPQLLPFLDYDAIGDDFYFIRPFIRGKTLVHSLKNNQLSFYRKIEIFLGLASLLSTLFQEKVVYLDILPENILLGAEGELKLVDSCIGRNRFSYLSPEEAKGKPPSVFADQFSLGLVMFALLCEKPLLSSELSEKESLLFFQKYRGLSAPLKEEMMAQMKQSKEISQKMVQILERCLQVNPEDRFEHPQELVQKLEALKILLLEETVNKMPVQTRLAQGIPVKTLIQWRPLFYSFVCCGFFLFLGIYPYFDRVQSRILYQHLKQTILQLFS